MAPQIPSNTTDQGNFFWGDQMPKALEVMIVAGFNRKAGVDKKLHCTPNISEIQHAIEFLLQKENKMKTQMKENNIWIIESMNRNFL